MAWMKRKEAIKHALQALGYSYWASGDEFSPPSLSIAVKLQLLYNYLGLDITSTPGYKIVKIVPIKKKRSNRAKKGKK